MKIARNRKETAVIQQDTIIAGKLNRLIRIEKQSVLQDDFGQERRIWAAVPGMEKIWAMRTERDGREAFEADRNTATAMCFFEIRHIAGIGMTMRLIDLATQLKYDIHSISEIGRKAGLRLLCSQKQQ